MRAAVLSALLLAAFVCGLFFTGYYDIIFAPAVLCVMLAFCGTVVPCLARVCNVPSGSAALLLFFLWLYVTLSLMWSTVPYASLVTWLVFLCLPATFFALSMPPDNRSLIMGAAGMLLAALTLLGGWTAVQGLFLRETFGMRAHHPLPNANDVATLLNLGLFPVLAYLFHVRERGRAFLMVALAAGLIFAGLLATQSRSGLLFALLGTGSLYMMLRPAGKRSGAIAGAGLAVFAAMQIGSGWRLAGRIMDLAGPAADPNVVSRISLWKSTAQMIADHPWGGTGLGTFYLYYPRYRAPLAENSAGFWAHNDFLQFGAEAGVAATVMLYALCVAVAWRTVRVMRGLKRESPRRAALAGFSCALLTLALHAQVGFPLYILPVLIVAGVWLAVWQHLADAGYMPLDIARWQRPVLAICAVAVAAMIGLAAASAAAGQYYFSRAQGGIRHGNVSVFADNIERAERFAPRSFIDPEVHLAGLYIDTIGGAGILFPDDRETMFAQTLELLDAAEMENPVWAEIDYKRGKLYAAVKDKEAAAEAWRKALLKNPQHDKARLALARELIAAGRPAAALDLLAEGLQYPVTRETADQYHILMKKVEGTAALQKKLITEMDKQP